MNQHNWTKWFIQVLDVLKAIEKFLHINDDNIVQSLYIRDNWIWLLLLNKGKG